MDYDKKSTDTDDEILAKAFAIENKDVIIHEYKERKKYGRKKTTEPAFTGCYKNTTKRAVSIYKTIQPTGGGF